METLDTRWRKSSYSGNGGDCVEVADYDNHLMVRDSKNPEDAKLAFTTASWKAFTAKVKASLAHPLPTCKGHSRVLRCPFDVSGVVSQWQARRDARVAPRASAASAAPFTVILAAYLPFLAGAWLSPWWWSSAALARLGCWPGRACWSIGRSSSRRSAVRRLTLAWM